MVNGNANFLMMNRHLNYIFKKGKTENDDENEAKKEGRRIY